MWTSSQLPMVKVSFFLGISSIYKCTEVDKSTLLLSIMAMASYSSIITSLIMVLLMG
jgi:hypothetical protein